MIHQAETSSPVPIPFFLAILILLLAVFAVSCQETEKTSSESEVAVIGDPEPIINGQTSPTLYTDMPNSDQNSVMRLIFTSGMSQGSCTCTLISPKVVLTAAHCIHQDSGTPDASQFVVLVGPNSYNYLDYLEVESVHYNSDWAPNTYDQERHDVGIVILSNRYYDTDPIPIKTGGVSALWYQNIQAVGYGITTNNESNPLRYWTTLPVEYVGSGQITVNGHGSTGISSGDSGGPLLYDFGNGIQVAGVASTSADGFVYEGNYASVATNESYILSFINQYDNPTCLAACENVDCGTYNGCACGSCDRGEECVGNTCEPMQAGEGGVCTSLNPGNECSTAADCEGENDICLVYNSRYSECAERCGPESCSDREDDAYCAPLSLQGGGYFNICLENNPESCTNEYESCTTTSGRSGICMQLYTNGPVGCYIQCETVETCPEGTGCQPYDTPSCEDICAGADCGARQGCDCGTCDDGEECIQNRCGGNYSCEEICGRAQLECGEYGDCDCGSCESGEVCQDYKCVASGVDCEVLCQRYECGPVSSCDCGDCSEGYACEDSTCVECTASCDGKECGDNGCGGVCGTCEEDEECVEGLCKSCEEVCNGLECGVYDGCNCGTCEATQDCVAGACIQGCVPSCFGKQCGADGCGGTCGTCAIGQTCNATNGTCETLVEDGDEDTGGNDQFTVGATSTGCRMNGPETSGWSLLLGMALLMLAFRSRMALR